MIMHCKGVICRVLLDIILSSALAIDLFHSFISIYIRRFTCLLKYTHQFTWIYICVYLNASADHEFYIWKPVSTNILIMLNLNVRRSDVESFCLFHSLWSTRRPTPNTSITSSVWRDRMCLRFITPRVGHRPLDGVHYTDWQKKDVRLLAFGPDRLTGLAQDIVKDVIGRHTKSNPKLLMAADNIKKGTAERRRRSFQTLV